MTAIICPPNHHAGNPFYRVSPQRLPDTPRVGLSVSVCCVSARVSDQGIGFLVQAADRSLLFHEFGMVDDGRSSPVMWASGSVARARQAAGKQGVTQMGSHLGLSGGSRIESAPRSTDTACTSAFSRIDVPISQWKSLLERFADRTIFQSPDWLSFISKTQNAEPVFAMLQEGGAILGYFSGFIVNRFGLRVLGSPLPGWTTSYMGMNLLPEVSRPRAVKALIDLAFGPLNCVHVELMDRRLTIEEARELGLVHRVYAGFEIDLTRSVSDLFGSMSSACRRCIRAADKRGVTIEECRDLGFADDYYAQLRQVFEKQALIPSYGVERVRELIACLAESGQLLLLRARDPAGRCIATGIFPASHDTMYFWGGASRRDSLSYRPNEAIQWYAMQYWRSRGVRRYDMGGGGEYKRKFGGSEIAVPWIRKSKHPAVEHIRNFIQQAFHWRQKLFGTAAVLVKGGGKHDDAVDRLDIAASPGMGPVALPPVG
jgi:hypothetical protein